MPKHEWQGTKLRFQQTDKKWGAWTDLRGPAGKAGSGGGVYVAGGSSWSPDTLPPAADDPPEEFVVRQGGTWRRASYVQMQAWLGGAGPGTTDGVLTEDGNHLVTESGDNIVQE